VATKATSFRLDEGVHQELTKRARKEGIPIRALLERLVTEGLSALEHPGIVYRGAPGRRRAALAAGPDVWEIMDALRQVAGTPEQRITEAAQRLELHPRQVRLAVEYAAAHPEEIQAAIADNDAEAQKACSAAEARGDLLAS
jgi:hypothetical protein